MDVSNFKIIRSPEKAAFMNERMAKGYSFRYIKGKIDNCDTIVNIGIECVDTNEFFPFQYDVILSNPI